MNVLRIGTRGSRLALAQAAQVKRRLERLNKGLRCRLVVIKTTGDEFQTVELFKKTNIGVFTKALEKKLLAGNIDVAVHSLKDLPTVLPKGLVLAAFPKRLDTGDALISAKRYNLRTLPLASRVGTGSPRRKSQLKRLRPDLELLDIRGNLDTRVDKVIRQKKYDAVVVAKAGLLRLKKFARYAAPIAPDQLLPAVGQAALGLEARAGDHDTLKLLRRINHPATEKRVLAERAFLHELRGGCRVPVGVHSAIKNGRFFLKAAVFSTHSGDCIGGDGSGAAKDHLDIAKQLARRLLKKGAAKFLKEARS